MVSGLAKPPRLPEPVDFEWMKALQTAEKLSVLMIDVDHFKMSTTPMANRKASLPEPSRARCRRSPRHDGLAARYGGEEFCLLLPGVGEAYALQFGETVRAGGGSPCDSPPTTATASSPSASASPPSRRARRASVDLIEAADAALYAAKRRGRNAVVAHGLIRVAGLSMPLAG